MSRVWRTLVALAWLEIIMAPAAGLRAEESFAMLDAKQIRAKVVGKDVTDGAHWSMFLRPDGTLVSAESGGSSTGSWKIQSDKLCVSLPDRKELQCHEVWMSGANIKMRASKDEEFGAIVVRHRT